MPDVTGLTDHTSHADHTGHNSPGTSSATPHVRVRRERRYRPLQAGRFHLLTRVTAPSVPRVARQRPPLDLAFVVDRSGSMAGGAFDLARQGVEHALRLLDEGDSVSLVVYDDEITVLLSQRLCDREAREKANRRLRRVGPRGSTDLAGGWLTGCDQLAPIADGTRVIRVSGQRPVCRALLLTDGLANVGITDADEIARHARELRQRSISTSTFGVGAHYDEVLLAGMADAGNGHFHHIPDASAIAQVFAGELGELLDVAMRDVTVAIRPPTHWGVHVLNDLPIERSDGWTTVPIGEMTSNETRSLVWAIDLPAARNGEEQAFDLRITWSDADGTQTFEHSLSHQVRAHSDPGERDTSVSDELAAILGARARSEAIRLNRSGDYAGAQRVITDTVATLPDSPAGREVAESLHALAVAASAQMSGSDMKRHYTDARNTHRQRRDYSN